MKNILKRMKDIGEAVLYEIVDYFLAFACMGTVVDNRVCITLAIVSLLISFYFGFKILNLMGAFV
ncbi:hypothetical protein [Marasmitruncus massiliensis]|uniref:hypothetical protein n=1 Tax=Marasmitruncus massiliensis TaxID=1944642 RepID=UPI000C7D891B|nr:hypothetical protein [Marasmitruncus massiliensis]